MQDRVCLFLDQTQQFWFAKLREDCLQYQIFFEPNTSTVATSPSLYLPLGLTSSSSTDDCTGSLFFSAHLKETPPSRKHCSVGQECGNTPSAFFSIVLCLFFLFQSFFKRKNKQKKHLSLWSQCPFCFLGLTLPQPHFTIFLQSFLLLLPFSSCFLVIVPDCLSCLSILLK